MTSPDPWLVRRPRDRSPAWRLVCLPHAGAGAGAFASWFGQVPPDCELMVVRLPGRESRYREPPAPDADAVVAGLLPALLPLLDRPTVLFGHSMGALLAYHLTQALRRRSAPLPQLLAVSGHEGPGYPRSQPPLHDLPAQQFTAAIAELGGTPPAVLGHPELFELLAPTLRADLRLVETYRPRPEPPWDVRTAVYVGTDDRTLDAAGVAAWAAVSRAPVRSRKFPGDHFYLFDSSRAVIEALAADAGLA